MNNIIDPEGEFFSESQPDERENWMARNRFPYELCAGHIRFNQLNAPDGEADLFWKLNNLSAQIVAGTRAGSLMDTITLVSVSAYLPKKKLVAGREVTEEQSWLESIPRLQVERRKQVIGSGTRNIPLPVFLKHFRPVGWTDAEYLRLLESYTDEIAFEQSLFDLDRQTRAQIQAKEAHDLQAIQNPMGTLSAGIAAGVAAALVELGIKPHNKKTA